MEQILLVHQQNLYVLFKKWITRKLVTFLEENGGDCMVWKRNPPHASNMGGVCKQQISACWILNSLLKTHRTHRSNLTEESLQTLVGKAEAIVNSRPLTTEVMNDATGLAPLSPINLLTMKSRVVMPSPGNFTTPDRYSKKQWRRVQHVGNKFWEMEKRGPADSSKQGKMKQPKTKLPGWGHCVTKTRSISESMAYGSDCNCV